jgi:uncharacterized membrane-anchored protein
MAEASTTTRPARTRRPAAGTAAKTASKAPAKPAAEKTETVKTEVTRFTVELEHMATTKSYEKFGFPDSYKGVVVGNVYAPIGTERVAVLIVGAGDKGDAPAE